ncbi:DUF3304 domain-containing protein [Trinickia caryophylli]|uniref:DUF3304 domain-containing protein n=1 Tax=Trinickia caryophylli TaxID=28094 RepID=A0A1X7HBA2_TRICW|nr:DUF3304 domain-containing protein [Trinickia caryophylli]PMS13675.1 DUF3304 domain-containing protein [Trinickia caryophylli]TRX14167.1 DUF3304 domain-containing protein [Trinickia caryophylli]WQE13991.1 DUF3304 domain-containing protein [Trinickia caryophylli]SMF83226.1 Protein of unknown function [Trinickia caryophylli]GLU33528.1 hypothetical protein Busp01_33700 [Trinickia caryophylli]
MIFVNKRIVLPVFAALVLAGCDAFSSEPVYRGISVEGMNYTPFNLTRFVIRDKYGNRASGGGDLMPGAGEGRLSCCYKLKGTDFTVDWEIYDADEAVKNIYAPIKKIHKTTQIHFPKTKISGGAGDVALVVHFYPDYHVEFDFRNDLSGSRIDYSAVDYWLQTKYGKAANPGNLNEFTVFRKTARVASQGWLKYRLTDTADLEQYVYYMLLVNPKFDEHPAVQRILQDSKGKPGAFGAAMQKLPDAVVQEIKNNHFEHMLTGATR